MKSAGCCGSLAQLQRKLLQHLDHMWLDTCIVVYPTLPNDGGMAEDHGTPEAGQLSRIRTRGRRDRELPKSGRRKESAAGQFRMR